MSYPEIIDLCSDDEGEEANVNVVKQEPADAIGVADVNVVKQEPGLDPSIFRQKRNNDDDWAQKQTSTSNDTCQECPANGSANAINTTHGNSSILGQVGSSTNGSAFGSRLPPAPLCRQFWKAGNYDDTQASKLQHQSMY